MSKVILKEPFEMPDVDETTVLSLREPCDLTPYCWLWNASVGYLEVVKYSGYDIFVTVKNTGMSENAPRGTMFPSCMEFLITAPNATPIIDNTATCLKADFHAIEVGQEALMSVESTAAIKNGDVIIVAGDYQYYVSEVVNETTLRVVNEGKGATVLIKVNCDMCTPVKIFESTHCCQALSEAVDDINERLENKGNILSHPDNENILEVVDGMDTLSDCNKNVYIKLDTDLSKYDNSASNFATQDDIGDLPRDLDLSHYDNSVTKFMSSGDIPGIPSANLTSNTDVLDVTSGEGATLINASLTLDKDLSKYDNSVSKFLSAGEDLTSTNSLLSVSGGTGAVANNTTLTVDNDLSHYSNANSDFANYSFVRGAVNTAQECFKCASAETTVNFSGISAGTVWQQVNLNQTATTTLTYQTMQGIPEKHVLLIGYIKLPYRVGNSGVASSNYKGWTRLLVEGTYSKIYNGSTTTYSTESYAIVCQQIPPVTGYMNDQVRFMNNPVPRLYFIRREVIGNPSISSTIRLSVKISKTCQPYAGENSNHDNRGGDITWEASPSVTLMMFPFSRYSHQF